MTKPAPFLPNTRFFPLDPVLLQRELNLSYSDVANAINIREQAVYSTQEIATGQKFFTVSTARENRATLRKVFTATSILNGTTSIPHGITIQPTTVFTRIYGTGTNPSTQFIPLPYVNVAAPADGITLRVTATNIEIVTTTANWTAYSALIILEYIPI